MVSGGRDVVRGDAVASRIRHVAVGQRGASPRGHGDAARGGRDFHIATPSSRNVRVLRYRVRRGERDVAVAAGRGNGGVDREIVSGRARAGRQLDVAATGVANGLVDRQRAQRGEHHVVASRDDAVEGIGHPADGEAVRDVRHAHAPGSAGGFERVNARLNRVGRGADAGRRLRQEDRGHDASVAVEDRPARGLHPHPGRAGDSPHDRHISCGGDDDLFAVARGLHVPQTDVIILHEIDAAPADRDIDRLSINLERARGRVSDHIGLYLGRDGLVPDLVCVVTGDGRCIRGLLCHRPRLLDRTGSRGGGRRVDHRRVFLRRGPCQYIGRFFDVTVQYVCEHIQTIGDIPRPVRSRAQGFGSRTRAAVARERNRLRDTGDNTHNVGGLTESRRRLVGDVRGCLGLVRQPFRDRVALLLLHEDLLREPHRELRVHPPVLRDLEGRFQRFRRSGIGRRQRPCRGRVRDGGVPPELCRPRVRQGPAQGDRVADDVRFRSVAVHDDAIHARHRHITRPARIKQPDGDVPVGRDLNAATLGLQVPHDGHGPAPGLRPRADRDGAVARCVDRVVLVQEHHVAGWRLERDAPSGVEGGLVVVDVQDGDAVGRDL